MYTCPCKCIQCLCVCVFTVPNPTGSHTHHRLVQLLGCRKLFKAIPESLVPPLEPTVSITASLTATITIHHIVPTTVSVKTAINVCCSTIAGLTGGFVQT